MKKVFCALVACALFGTAAQAQTSRWQTTHVGTTSGNCQLESNKFRITVNPLMVDIEEEAIIYTMGTVSWGDPATLEIVGEFTLTPGSVIRSMLLWNGNQLLKAKLKDKAAADSAYEDVVDRDKPQFIPRDPAIIECISDNRYRYRIYPVAINASRKIRILYSVPLQAFANGPQFQIQSIFTTGPSQVPTEIPVEFKRADTTARQYYLQYGDMKKTIQFGATYLLVPSDFSTQPYYYWQQKTPMIISIIPDTTARNQAYAAKVLTGNAAGHYTTVFASTPATVSRAVNRMIDSINPMIETKIVTSEKTYIKSIPYQGCFGLYLKSSTNWDKKITWTIYKTSGNVAYTYVQNFTPDTSSNTVKTLPLVWAAKYSTDVNMGSLGSIFGFVDKAMSLLALESDSLTCVDAAPYRIAGVPLLKPSEIIVDSTKKPSLAPEIIFFEMNANTHVSQQLDILTSFEVRLLPDGLLMVQFSKSISAELTVELYDMSGRQVWNGTKIRITGAFTTLKLPNGMKGAFVVKIKAGGQSCQKKIILK